MDIDGILVLFHHPNIKNAGTVLENIFAFGRHSKYKTCYVNTAHPFPEELRKLSFRCVILHYSIFGIHPFRFDSDYSEYLAQSNSAKMAFFQDEYRFCRPRFEFINKFGIDCIFTLFEEQYFAQTYQHFTNAKKIVQCIPGYVSDEIISASKFMQYPEEKRTIDISYRGRENPPYLGMASFEKREIGRRFKKMVEARALDISLDIDSREENRIYGNQWLHFMASSKAALGVESGSSIVDFTGNAYALCSSITKINPQTPFEEMYESFLHFFEGDISYKTISPRHFEAASLKTSQILFEGCYSGILKPDVHFIELKKDFSNFDEVIEKFNNKDFRAQLNENAYRDVIESGKYTYEYFIKNSFDPVVAEYMGSAIVSAEQEAAIKRVQSAQFDWWNFVNDEHSLPLLPKVAISLFSGAGSVEAAMPTIREISPLAKAFMYNQDNFEDALTKQ